MIVNDENNRKIAYDVLKLRLAQIIVNEKYKAGKFKIPIHLALGHEAIAVAVNYVMEPNDLLLLSHRNIAYNLARLGSLKPIIDEYFLKPTGIMNGKMGSMNLINPKKGIVYSSSILGNNFAVAVGISMAQKIRKQNGLTIVLGGDGAIEEGSFHESLLMSKSLQSSILFIIENNEWSMSTCIYERRHSINLEKLTSAYDIKYEKLVGNDPYNYIENLTKLKKQALEDQTPICVEVAVTTLGDWKLKTPEFPDGKFVNYHAGPTPSIKIEDWPKPIKNSDEDPMYVLNKYYDQLELQKMSEIVRNDLEEELK